MRTRSATPLPTALAAALAVAALAAAALAVAAAAMATTAATAATAQPPTPATAPAVAAQPPPPTAAAPSPTLRADHACYLDHESMVLSGAGFTPDGRVTLSASGQQLGTVGADAEGGFGIRVGAPSILGTLRLRFVAADRSNRALTAATVVRVTSPDVLVTGAGRRAPAGAFRVRAWGFIGTGPLYAHAIRHGARRARNVKLGTPRGACGTLDVRRRLLRPAARSGRYTLKFDTARRYVRNARPSITYRLSILRPARRATANLSVPVRLPGM